MHILLLSFFIAIFSARASELDAPEWKAFSAMRAGKKSYERAEFSKAITHYEKAKRSYKQCQNQESPVLGAINFGLYLSHNNMGNHDKAHDHLALAAHDNPTAAWLYADQLPNNDEKNKLLQFAYDSKQSPAAIILGDMSYEQGDINRACDYYARADQMLATEKNLSLVSWCEDLLECRLAQMFYDTGSLQEGLCLWQKTFHKTIFADVKKTVINQLSCRLSCADVETGTAWAQIADFSQSSTRAECIGFLRTLRKVTTEFDTRLVPMLDKLMPYLDRYDDDTKDLIVQCYQSLNPEIKKAHYQTIERILNAVGSHDAHWFTQKLAFFIERAQTDNCHLATCASVLKKGIKNDESLSLKEKSRIGNLLKQLAEKKEFEPYIKVLKQNNMWRKYADFIEEKKSEEEHIDLKAQRIYEDRYDKIYFDTKVTPLLLKVLQGSDRKAQAKAIDLIAVISYRLIFFDNQDHQKIINLLSSLKHKLDDKKDLIEYLVYSLSNLLSLRELTDKPLEQIDLIQNRLPDVHSKSIKAKNTRNELRYAKHLADLYAEMSVLCKKHGVRNKIKFAHDFWLLDAETCMHGAITAYNLLSKQTQDPAIAQAAALRIAEIALFDIDVFTEYGPDNDPFNFIRQILIKFVHDNPHSINVRFLLAKLYTDGIPQEVDGNKVRVGKDLDSAIAQLEILRGYKYGHFKLAECYREKAEFEQATLVCLEGYEHTKNDLLPIYAAEACLQAGNIKAAKEALKKLKNKKLEDNIKNQRDMIKLFILCKKGIKAEHKIAQALDKIPLSIIHQKSIKHAYKYLNQHDMKVLTDFGDKLVQSNGLAQKEIQLLTKIGAILLYASEFELSCYEKSIIFLEEAVQNLSIHAAHLLAQDERYVAEKDRCNKIIDLIGSSALSLKDYTKTFDHKLILEEFKAHILAQTYLIVYTLLIAQSDVKNIPLLGAGCAIAAEAAENTSYDDPPDDYCITLLEQVTNRDRQQLKLTELVENVFKQVREDIIRHKGKKDATEHELKKLGMYGTQTCLMRCYLAAAKKAALDNDSERGEEYLDNAFYYLTDLALSTGEIVAPSDNAKRVLAGIRSIAEIAASLKISDVRYYQDLAEILKKAKLLKNSEWISCAYDAGCRMFLAAKKNQDQVLTLAAFDLLFYGAQYEKKSHTLCLKQLTYIQSLLDKEKNNELSSVEAQQLNDLPVADILVQGSKYRFKEALKMAITYFSNELIHLGDAPLEITEHYINKLALIYEYASDDAVNMIRAGTPEYTALGIVCDEYSKKLRDLLITQESKAMINASHQEELEKTLHILGLGCEKEYRPAVEMLLKYYSRMFNVEKNKKKKNSENLAFYKNALQRVCYMATNIKLDSVKCVQNNKGQNVYEVLYDMSTDSLLRPDDPTVKDFVERIV